VDQAVFHGRVEALGDRGRELVDLMELSRENEGILETSRESKTPAKQGENLHHNRCRCPITCPSAIGHVSDGRSHARGNRVKMVPELLAISTRE
jgi:hypothetical protein